MHSISSYELFLVLLVGAVIGAGVTWYLYSISGLRDLEADESRGRGGDRW